MRASGVGKYWSSTCIQSAGHAASSRCFYLRLHSQPHVAETRVPDHGLFCAFFTRYHAWCIGQPIQLNGLPYTRKMPEKSSCTFFGSGKMHVYCAVCLTIENRELWMAPQSCSGSIVSLKQEAELPAGPLAWKYQKCREKNCNGNSRGKGAIYYFRIFTF